VCMVCSENLHTVPKELGPYGAGTSLSCLCVTPAVCRVCAEHLQAGLQELGLELYVSDLCCVLKILE